MLIGICNPDELSIRNQRSAAEGKANLNPKSALQMLILGAGGLQIHLSRQTTICPLFQQPPQFGLCSLEFLDLPLEDRALRTRIVNCEL